MKRLFVIIAAVVVMSIGAVALAATPAKTPAEIVADLTGKTVDQVIEAREDGKTYGAQAAEADKLQEFKDERLAQYEIALDEAVQENRITQAEADELYETMESRMDSCTGNGAGAGSNNGCGLGNMMRGSNGGNGLGRMNGSCENCPKN
jgi:hypothetical protein